MNQIILVAIIMIMILVLVSLLIAFLIVSMWAKVRREELEITRQQEEDRHLREAIEREKLKVEYSDALLKSIQNFIFQYTTLKFKSFNDNTYTDKITRSQLSNLAETIARDIHGYFTYLADINEYTYFSTEFLNTYIVNTTFEAVKTMLDKVLNNEIL